MTARRDFKASELKNGSSVTIDEQLGVVHHFGGGVYAKETVVPAGFVLVQHKHEHDHLSVLASGTVELLVDGVRSEMTGPACITIAAGKHHGVKALTDVVWYCIHATDCTDPEQADKVLIVPSDEDMDAIARSML
ncbi:hypothetical protein [Variovorax boronicumulans]|uniref:hypothetical protein n=1 Tax=Variovorax boronicumulans TaxID=436515 RepID=UPI000B01D8F7|nr:hypothetical protein [Variovorax boronicumulans]